ncbi:MAG TPA: lysylphosphatidylglycerol synthase transmembrane domain-containing protein [Actinocrinis sp.]|nr:lysylphosphatidylglycerol synthase transmembrane domain-containing protein [Actinocrinis sp.]
MTTIAVDEPPAPHRIRRRSDLVRALLGLALIVLIVALADFGRNTTNDFERYLAARGPLSPAIFTTTTSFLAACVAALIPAWLVAHRIIRREGRALADAVLAATLACLGAYGIDRWISSTAAPHWLAQIITRPLPNEHTTALPLFIATVIAFISTIGFGDRSTLQAITWGGIFCYAAADQVGGRAALTGLMVTFVFGRAVANGYRFARGVLNDRPTGPAIAAALADAGLVPVACRWLGQSEGARRYEVRTGDGRRLAVHLLDRDLQTVGLLTHVYRRIRLRTPVESAIQLSLQRTVNQEALITYALRDAEIRTPRLVAVHELSGDTAMMAYELVVGRSLDEVGQDELTDELLTELWTTHRQLCRSQIAHRQLTGDSFVVDDVGRVWLRNLRNGAIAASQLQLRLDTAELLAVLALRFGARRTVQAGAAVLGPDVLGAALPLLQQVALARPTRLALRHSKGLLAELREQVLALHPQVARTEPAKLERLRPRTLMSVGAGGLAVYLVLYILSHERVNPVAVLAGSSPLWLLLAVAASVGTYLAAGLVLTSYVPEKLPFGSTLETQVAGSFVTLVAPSAVGGVALNTRFLQRQGIGSGPAIAAVSASQAVGFVLHIILIAVFGFLVGSSAGGHTHAPSTVIILILLALAIACNVVLAIPGLRRFAVARLRPFFAGTLPRLLDVAQNPRKMITGLGATISLSLLYALCLWASVHGLSAEFSHNHEAVGSIASFSYAGAVVVFLTAQAAGNLVPTPGGIGGVEVALIGALELSGVDASVAPAAVLLFRLITCYLRVLPGWAALVHLQRKGML